MKKKQVFRTILILCTVLLMFAGCHSEVQSESEYKVLEIGYSGTARGAKHSTEYVFPASDKSRIPQIEPQLEGQVASIVVGNQKFTGEYTKSVYRYWNDYQYKLYKTADGVEFSFNDTGTLSSFYSRNIESKGEFRTEQECIEIATSFVKPLLNLQDYTVECCRNEHLDAYEITFTKYLNGYKTSDYAEVSILCDGEVRSYRANMLGRIPADTMPDIDHNTMVEAVYQKLDEIYEEVTGYDELTYDDADTWKFTYTVLEDGSPAMLCSMNVEFCQAIGGGQSLVSGELENFLILL